MVGIPQSSSQSPHLPIEKEGLRGVASARPVELGLVISLPFSVIS